MLRVNSKILLGYKIYLVVHRYWIASDMLLANPMRPVTILLKNTDVIILWYYLLTFERHKQYFRSHYHRIFYSPYGTAKEEFYLYLKYDIQKRKQHTPCIFLFNICILSLTLFYYCKYKQNYSCS